MKLDRIEIFQFGGLKDKELHFSEGFNLISGGNESGKSTLHTALAALLFGMEKGRGRAAQSDRFHQYLPWNDPSVYGGALDVSLKQEAFRIERDFAQVPPVTRFSHLEGDAARSMAEKDFSLPNGLTPFLYFNTLSFRQLQTDPGEGLASELRSHVLNLQSSGDEQVNISGALSSLRDQKKEYERRIDAGAEDEYAQTQRALQLAEQEDLTEGEEALRELQRQKEVHKQQLNELTAERSRLCQLQEHKRALFTKSCPEGSERIDSDSALLDPLSAELAAYREGYMNNERPARELQLYSGLSLIAALALLWSMIRLYQTHVLWPLPFIFMLAILLLTLYMHNGHLLDARDANTANKKLLEELIHRYLPEYVVTGTSEEALQFQTYLQKLKGLEREQQELSQQVEQKTQEIIHLSTLPVFSDELMENQLEFRIKHRQWEERVRALQDRLDALKPVLEANRRYRKEIEAIQLAISTITQLSQEVSRDFGTPLTETASEIFREITGGRYDGVRIGEALDIEVIRNHRTIQPASLSAGALEQLYFAFRMAMIRLIWPEEPMPLFLDDSFALYDKDRLASLLDWLHQHYRGQVFLFSCQEREEALLTAAGIPFTKHELT